MQDIYKITMEQLKEAINAGLHPVVIINGEYYEIEPEKEETEK